MEYIEMKFCERFHISPLEYARLPRKKIDLWLQMMDTESSVNNWREKREQSKKTLLRK